MTDPVGREEFTMLREMVQDNGRRLDEIDRGGTRGVGAISVQLTEVIKDVATVQNDLSSFRRDHEAQHQREQAARQSARRWAIGTGIAALASVQGPLIYLVAHLH